MNPALTPAKSPTFTVAGKPVKVRKINEQTVEFKFDAPMVCFCNSSPMVRATCRSSIPSTT